ncbi:MAG TPA: aminotransferase class V-fold PLP-dependent enzyme [Gemmatimonadaceae bacterium]|nr:aminotransferase class V-fold PLP-dependent enzyme [Gemmatimonadaceae bacterium]
MTISLQDVRAREFPWADRGDTIYLNHASTGPLTVSAQAAMDEFTALRAEPWRISKEMQFSALDRARALSARLIGARVEDVALMVNTSYGLNLAARALPLAAGDVVVTSDREFPSNIYPWMALERSRGVTLRIVPCRDRLVDEEAILSALDAPGVRVLVLSWVSFETGARIDVARLGEACRARGIWFVLDAIQGIGAAPLNVADLPVDIVACGAQKWLLSPWGSGFVWIRPEVAERIEPVDVSWMAVRGSDDFTRLIDYDFTWRDDARRFEMVTLPFQDFAGMAASLAVMEETGFERITSRTQELATRIVEWATARPDVRLVTPADPSRRAGIVTVALPEAGKASAALSARGVVHSLREGGIRLAPYFYTTDEEVEKALRILDGCVQGNTSE